MTFPLTEHPTWAIRDSSKLDDWLTCPRKYFYLHILGWRLDIPSHDLHFGSAWHKAREHQLIHGYSDVEGAYTAFLNEYRKHFDPETDELYKPKNPTAVLNALMQFASERQSDLIDNEVVVLDGTPMTEVSGTVPVDDKRLIHYRMDSVMHKLDDDKYFSWDHKSTSGKWIHDTRWDEDLYLSFQNGTYTHCLYCMFPIEQVLGVEFIKTGFEHLERGSKNRPAGYHATTRYIPAFKTPDQMNVWLWSVNRRLDEIEREMDLLHHCKEEDEVLMAFPQNPKSCTAYGGCSFHDFCLSWSNPLQRAYEPPLGYRTDFWDPSTVKTTVKKDLNWREI